MKSREKSSSRSPFFAAMIFCAFALVHLSSAVALLGSAEVAAQGREGETRLIARLALTDCASVRPQKFSPSFEGKQQRRLEPLAQPVSSNQGGLFDARARHTAAPAGRRDYSLTAIAPPSDRAPPRLTL